MKGKPFFLEKFLFDKNFEKKISFKRSLIDERQLQFCNFLKFEY